MELARKKDMRMRGKDSSTAYQCHPQERTCATSIASSQYESAAMDNVQFCLPLPLGGHKIERPTTTLEAGSLKPKALKYKRRICKVGGCQRTVKSQQLCQRHGAKPRLCKVELCKKQAQGTFEGMCKAHFKDSKTQGRTHESSPRSPYASVFSDTLLLPYPSHNQRPTICSLATLSPMTYPFYNPTRLPLCKSPDFKQTPPKDRATSSSMSHWKGSEPDAPLKSLGHLLHGKDISMSASGVFASWIDRTDFRKFVVLQSSGNHVTCGTQDSTLSTQNTDSMSSSSACEEETEDLASIGEAFDEDLSKADFIHPSMWDDGVGDVSLDFLDVHFGLGDDPTDAPFCI